MSVSHYGPPFREGSPKLHSSPHVSPDYSSGDEHSRYLISPRTVPAGLGQQFPFDEAISRPGSQASIRTIDLDLKQHNRLPSLSTILSPELNGPPRQYQHDPVQRVLEHRYATTVKREGAPILHPSSQPSPHYALPTDSHPGTTYSFSQPNGKSDAASSSQRNSGISTSSKTSVTSVLPEPVQPDPQAPQPKVIARREVAGYGECFIFDNDTFCPANIGGEPVNPHWGVTKAGKPRKRLAQACMACREKKVRCPLRPGETSCDHCAKAGRECVKPANHRASPEPEQYEMVNHDGTTRSLRRIQYSNSETEVGSSRKRACDYLPQATPARSETPASKSWVAPVPGTIKRRKSHSSDCGSGWAAGPSSSKGAYGKEGSFPDVSAVDTSNFDCGTDPFLDVPEATAAFIDLYYKHRGGIGYTMIPQEIFTQWALRCKEKTRDERMVLYAILAMGAKLSPSSDGHQFLSTKLMQAAQQGAQNRSGKPSLQLAQTRFYLCLWHFASGKNELGWEYLTSGYSTIGALNLNTEQGVSEVFPEDIGTYGLNQNQLIECRRRTVWVGYMMDRYLGYCGGHGALFIDDDLLIRLPQSEHDFMNDKRSDAPFFEDIYDEDAEPLKEELGGMAQLVLVVSIWGEMTAYMYRTKYKHSKRGYRAKHQAEHELIKKKLDKWRSLLAPWQQYSVKNTKDALEKGRFSLYFIMHCVEFVTSLKLHRFGRFADLEPDQVKYHIKEAHKDARQLLMMASQLARVAASGEPYSKDIEFTMAQPFPGYTILAACDIVSVGGGGPQSMQLASRELTDARMLVNLFGRFWFTATKQADKIGDRLKDLSAIGLRNIEGHWRIRHPIEASFVGLEHDLLYGIPEDFLRETFLGAE